MSFYDNLKKLCDEKAISPTTLAREINIPQSSVATWKKRGSVPKYETLKKIADYFETNIEDLLGFSEEKKKEIKETVKYLQYAGMSKEEAFTSAIASGQADEVLKEVKNLEEDIFTKYDDNFFKNLLLEAFEELPRYEKARLAIQTYEKACPYIGAYRKVAEERMNGISIGRYTKSSFSVEKKNTENKE